MAPVIALIDMDCFYVQVHQRLDPNTRNAPAVVVQYNPWRGGGILSVNYEARSLGVTRAMRGDDAREKCPGINVFQVPEERGKANLTKYREASVEVFNVICNFSDLITVEKASIDEAFLDLTKLVEKYTEIPCFDSICETYLPQCSQCSGNSAQTYDCCFKHFYDYFFGEFESDLVAGEENRKYVIAAKIVQDIRDEIFKKTQFRCSAGISSSKMLSKLSCSMRKPNGQTVLPSFAISTVLSNTPIHKVRNLGGKLGEEVKSKLGIEFMGDIKKFTIAELTKHFGNKTAVWLMSMANGVDGDEVVLRLIPKSIGCSKQFPGQTSLKTKSEVSLWISKLVEELIQRLSKDRTENERIAKLVNVSMRFSNRESVIRSFPLRAYDANVVTEDLMRNIVSRVLNNVNGEEENLKESVTILSLSSSKFVDSIEENRNAKLESFYSKVDKPTVFNDSRNLDSDQLLRANADSSDDSTFSEEFPQKRGFFYRKTLELMKLKDQ